MQLTRFMRSRIDFEVIRINLSTPQGHIKVEIPFWNYNGCFCYIFFFLKIDEGNS